MISIEKYAGPSIAELLLQKQLDGSGDIWREKIDRVMEADVEKALAMPVGVFSLERLIVLISPAARKYLEQMAQAANRLTIQRFGRAVRMYAPLYVSNYCNNGCRYCGFNRTHHYQRTRLTIDQAMKEADVIASEGFRDILLVSGEDRKFIDVDYLVELTQRLREKFSYIAAEIYQLEPEEYEKLSKAGVAGVTIYQETYDREQYKYWHQAGKKADYDRRLIAADSICSAGMREIGLGVLLGLKDWRIETLAMGLHANYLMKRYWKSHVSFSFPRIRPATEVERAQFEYLMPDEDLVQMVTALRLCFADAGEVISTRESALFRDNLIKIGITKTSAGSKTNPGGYSEVKDATEQFKVNDDRSPELVTKAIKQAGFEPVWKDWDRAFVESK